MSGLGRASLRRLLRDPMLWSLGRRWVASDGFREQVSGNLRWGLWRADGGRVACSAWNCSLAGGGAASWASRCGAGLPWARCAGCVAARHRSSEILARQAGAPAFHDGRIDARPPRHHPFGGGRGRLRLGLAAQRSAALGGGPRRGRISVTSRRRHADPSGLAADLAVAPYLGASALQIWIAIRAARRSAAAVLGRVWNFRSSAAAGHMEPVGPGVARAAARRCTAASQSGR